ncbi:unnamed protein product [Lymnaea stagnalis]|uniref:C-type lectin domain-containing protein n=1 Tax=Lymnaea stagnalis TaxID=6523 RepID=A0AAV2HV29_LYMST
MFLITPLLVMFIFERFKYVHGQASTSFGANLFKKKLATTCGPVRLGPSWTQSSQISCAVSCKERYPKTCHSFIYNKITHLCTPGSGVSTNQLPPSAKEGDLYVTDSCDSYPQFSILSYKSSSTFAVHIPVPVSYTQATVTCQCLDSHLYVAKTLEKFALFSNLINPNCTWLGLDDIQVEGQFLWSDDHQQINPMLMRALFPLNRPDNALGYQNCVMGCGQGLDDDFCTQKNPFICEKSNSLCRG